MEPSAVWVLSSASVGPRSTHCQGSTPRREPRENALICSQSPSMDRKVGNCFAVGQGWLRANGSGLWAKLLPILIPLEFDWRTTHQE